MMDLTSMLNGNPTTDESYKGTDRQELNGQIQSKNKTPWDNGGYALPINTISTLPTTPQHTSKLNETYFSTPTSPPQNSSGSRSSISSISSVDSSAHSRYPSMSVVEACSQSPSGQVENVYDSPSPKSAASSSDKKMGWTSNQVQYQDRSLSPSSSTMPEQNSMNNLQRLPEPSRISTRPFMIPIMEKEASLTSDIHESRRPISPSDAVLIKRPTIPSLRLVTRDSKWTLTNPNITNKAYQNTPEQAQLYPLTQSKSHKRALSAPSFKQPYHQLVMPTHPSTISRDEPTPPSSHHPDDSSPTMVTNVYQAPATPPSFPLDTEAQSVKCMYIPHCDTGSQLRKAISHIFGRNKICTRQIPSHVWVHYCRKHYQRSRYRNPKEYAKLQCDLVQQQIRRVHEWSQINESLNKAGVVRDWSMSVRKREQKRLDDLQSGKKRKSIPSEEEEDGDEDSNVAGGKPSNSAIPATAVPKWLLEHCRKGYSTQEILGIFNRLHQEILDDTISTFPDIEILPNISIDHDEQWSPKTSVKRLQNSHHKRPKSLSTDAAPIYVHEDRRISHCHSYVLDPYSPDGTILKRQLTGVSDGNATEPAFQHSARSRIPELGRRVSALGLHPRIDENSTVESYYNFSPSKPLSIMSSSPRCTGQPLSTQIDSSPLYHTSAHRPLHQRSHSDMSGGFHHGQHIFHSQDVSMYPPIYIDTKYPSRDQNYEPSLLSTAPVGEVTRDNLALRDALMPRSVSLYPHDPFLRPHNSTSFAPLP
ncbi:BgTH12-06315 [Blumeria graminis f. sp. triticale]|uniref:BgTH12-06315 n=1 Tax=Blumeria graminis f. sp. triticale TaxID=1689686 RepID=A0A9W4CXE9_BLUGR|nr:BgTH12-06315 [Blumeria graminis f. sp. triticale]